MQTPDPEGLYNALQGGVTILAVVGLAGASIRRWVKRKRGEIPKLPGDTFSAERTAPDPELVALRKEVSDLRATVTQVQGQLTTALAQNRSLFELQASMGAENGAYRRRVRQLEDAWPDGVTRPAIPIDDLHIIRSAINEDTLPYLPKEEP